MLSAAACCCGATGTCLVCSPCQIPRKTLAYAYTGVSPLSPTSGSGPLVFNGASDWGSSSFAGGYTIDYNCVSGFGIPTIRSSSGFGLGTLNLTSTSCNPFALTYAASSLTSAYIDGFRTLTISDPGPLTPCPEPHCIITFHVRDVCGGFRAGFTVLVKEGSTVYASGTTDSSGKVTLDVGAPGAKTVTVEPIEANYATFNGPITVACGHTQDIVLQPEPGWTCCPCATAANPLVSGTTLSLTDPEYGGVTLTGTGGETYVGTKTVSANVYCPLTGICNCVAGSSVDLTYTYNDPRRAGCALLIEWDRSQVCPDCPGGVLTIPSMMLPFTCSPYSASFGPSPDCTFGHEYLLWNTGTVWTISS